MNKNLTVVVVFKFAGIDDPDSEAADAIVDSLTQDTETWRTEVGAVAAYVDEAFVSEEV